MKILISLLNKMRCSFINGMCTLFFFLLSLPMSQAEVLCSFRIASVPTLQKLCSSPASSLIGYCLSSTIRNQSSFIPYELCNQDTPVFGAFVSVPEKMEYHFILFFPLNHSEISITLPQNYFSKKMEDYVIFSLSPEALSQAENNYSKIKTIFKNDRKDLSIYCSVRQTWDSFKVTAQFLRGIFLMSQSSEPDLQKMNFQLFEFGFFLLDSLNEIRLTLHKNPDHQNQTFHFTFNFLKDSPINTLFPEISSSELSEYLSSPDVLFRFAFDPAKVKDSTFQILQLLQNRMGFKPEDISEMKKNVTDLLGTNPASGLFILDCLSPSKNTDSPFIRIQQENLPLNLEMLSQKINTLIKSLPFTIITNPPAGITPEKNLYTELRLPSGQTLKKSLPSLLTHIINHFSPMNSLLDFSFNEKEGVLYGIPGKDSISNFNPSVSFQKDISSIFPFLKFKIKYPDFRNLYQACFSPENTGIPLSSPLKENLELSILFYYNEEGLNISLTLPNPILEISL